MREYCCTAVEIGWQLCASPFLRVQRLDERSSQRVGGFGLSRKPPMLRSRSCTQPRAAKATAGAAVVGSMGSIPRAAAVVWYTLLASGTRNADPVEKVEFFDWIRQSEFSVEKKLSRKSPFRPCKKARLGLQSKTAVFDSQIRLYKEWP